MKFVCTVVALAVSLGMVSNLMAADGPRRGPGGGQFNLIDMIVRGLELTDAQKAKIEDLKKTEGPKLREAMEKARDILSEDQRTAQREAMSAAREAGKTPEEAREAGLKAAKPTDEQKKKLDEVQAVQKAVREKVEAVLTPEQKEQAKKRAAEFRGRKPRANQ